MTQPPNLRQSSDQQPRDELDVAHRLIRQSDYDSLLREINLGTGYYDDDDLRLQMRSYRKGMVAELAVAGQLWERSVQETKVKLADEGFRYYDEQKDTVKIWEPLEDADIDEYGEDRDDPDYQPSRDRVLRARGDKIWRALGRADQAITDMQAAALTEKANVDSFKPVFWRLLAAYHEMTRSKGARTQDNFFGRVNKTEVETTEDVPDGFLGRRGGGGN